MISSGRSSPKRGPPVRHEIPAIHNFENEKKEEDYEEMWQAKPRDSEDDASQYDLIEENERLKKEVEILMAEREGLLNEVQTEYQSITTLAMKLRKEEKHRKECQDEIAMLKKEMALIKAERDSLLMERMPYEAAAATAAPTTPISEQDKPLPPMEDELRDDDEGNYMYISPSSNSRCDLSHIDRDSDAPIISSAQHKISNNRQKSSFPCQKSDHSAKSDGSITAHTKLEQKAIRIHAAKMLVWASEAIERQKSIRRTSEVLSKNNSYRNLNSSNNMLESSSSLPLQQETLQENHLLQRSQNPAFSPPSTPNNRNIDSNQHLPIVSPSSSKSEIEICDLKSADDYNGYSKIASSASTHSITDTKQQKKNKQKEEKGNSTRRDTANVISNLDGMDKNKTSSDLHPTSIFSGNPELVEFFLPKIEMSCNCSNNINNDDEYCNHCKEGKLFSSSSLVNSNGNSIELKNILRPWQVDFLASIEITTADQLLLAYEHAANDIAKAMKKWRAEVLRKPAVRTQSCYVALHIWCRTSKSILESVAKQQQKQQIQREMQQQHQRQATHQFDELEISFSSQDDIESVSTLDSSRSSVHTTGTKIFEACMAQLAMVENSNL